MKTILTYLILFAFSLPVLAQTTLDPTQRIDKNLRSAGNKGLSEIQATKADSLRWSANTAPGGGSGVAVTALDTKVTTLSGVVGTLSTTKLDLGTYTTNRNLDLFNLANKLNSNDTIPFVRKRTGYDLMSAAERTKLAGLTSGGGGTTGATPTIAIGAVTATSPGTNPVVTNTGSGTAATFNFSFPSPTNGINGSQGIQGIQGIAGIKGDTGAQGIQGVQGLAGPTGPQGLSGVAGATGVQGPKGDTGNNGTTGATGIQGIAGTQGIQGPKGDIGNTGPAGPTGTSGPISASQVTDFTAAVVAATPVQTFAGQTFGLNGNNEVIINPGSITTAQLSGTVLSGILNRLAALEAGGSSTTLTTPATPTAGVVDDAANTFNWTNTAGYANAGAYEYTLTGGAPYAPVTAKPIVVGNVAKAAGQVGVRVAAVSGTSNASGTLFNTAAYTVSSTTTAFVTSQNPTGTNRSDSNANIGFRFTVGSSNLSVTELGRLKYTGNTGNHTLSIYNQNQDVVIATVSVNMAAGTVGSYVYATLSSAVTLIAGTTYHLWTTETVGDAYDGDTLGFPITSTNAALINGSSYLGGNNNDANRTYVGVNFKYN